MKKLSKLLLFIALVSFSIQLNATQSDSITHKKYWGVYEMPTEKRTVTVLDSIVEFNAEGERRYNEEYVYDKNGIMILRTEYTWSENKQFPETSKKVYEYDINANLLKEVWYRWNIDTNDWICRTKWEYAYDKYNNKIFQKEFIYRTAKEQWEGYTYAYEYAYDERGNLLLEIKYFYDPGTSEMDSIFKKTYKYDNFDNKIEEVYYKWDYNTKDWKPEDKSEWAYDKNNNKIKYAEYIVESGDWQESLREEYSFNSQNEPSLKCIYRWKSDKKKMVMTYMEEYSYNEDYNLLSHTIKSRFSETYPWSISYQKENIWENGLLMSQHINSTLYSPPNFEKTEYEYDGSRQLLSSISYNRTDENEDWKPTGRYTYSYTGDGKKEEVVRSSWSYTESEWIWRYKEIYKYDSAGRRTIYMRYNRSNPKDSKKYESLFDENGNELMYAEYDSWTEETDLWIGDFKYEMDEYKTENDYTIINYIWDDTNNDWIKSSKSKLLKNPLDSSILQEDRFVWIGGEWVNNKKVRTEITTEGKNTRNIYSSYSWDIQNEKWIGIDKRETLFNEDKQVYYVSYNWNLNINDWVEYFKWEYTYTQDGFVKEHKAYYTSYGIFALRWTRVYHYSVKEFDDVGLENINNDVLISVFPNPTSENISFVFSEDSQNETLLSVFNMNGKMILSQTITSGTPVSVESLSQGTYLYRITLDNKEYKGKFIVK